ncbi:MAG: 5'-nucleotidase C-terminal domain-containing protein [Odoribacter sp.]|nr:5'-nucleotidase C-terminal domain-containing protein [Odoribacter sp.]
MFLHRFKLKNYCCVVMWMYVGLFMVACAPREQTIVLLHTNDSHGSILPVSGVGGMAERATVIDSLRKLYSNKILLLDAGDFNTGQAVSNMFCARPDILAYNYMKYDAVTLGNHEFDQPVDTLLQQMHLANFPFVISNVFYRGEPLGAETLVKEVNGVRVGLFGILTKATAQISVNVQDVTFVDEVEAARKAVKILQQQGVDLVIGIVHLGFTESTPEYITSQKLAAAVEGIDILVDGHSHSYIEKPLRVNETWIVTANQSGRFIGEGKVKVRSGDIISFDWKPLPVSNVHPHETLQAVLQPYVDVANKDLQTIIGEATDTFVLFHDKENLGRYGEVALGNLITDALKWKAEQLQLHVDFALTNSGGIREELHKGKVTKGDILSILPFGNELEVVSLKGDDVIKLFDFLATVELGRGTFPQVSKEVRVVFNRESKTVTSLTIGGKPIDRNRIYHMATCDYVAAGKDGYSAGLSNVVDQQKTSVLMAETLMEYIKQQGQVSPKTEGRIKF